MKNRPYTLEQCLAIYEWFNDPEYDFLMDIYLSKLDAAERLGRVLPQLRRKARKYVRASAGTDFAFPENLLNQAA